MALRGNARWLSQVTGIIFLLIHAYMWGKFTFESGNTAGMLLLISMVAALLTLVFGVLSLPRWQGLVALCISAYASYWFAFCRLYTVS
jgi:hypothetical protein